MVSKSEPSRTKEHGPSGSCGGVVKDGRKVHRERASGGNHGHGGASFGVIVIFIMQNIFMCADLTIMGSCFRE